MNFEEIQLSDEMLEFTALGKTKDAIKKSGIFGKNQQAAGIASSKVREKSEKVYRAWLQRKESEKMAKNYTKEFYDFLIDIKAEPDEIEQAFKEAGIRYNKES